MSGLSLAMHDACEMAKTVTRRYNHNSKLVSVDVEKIAELAGVRIKDEIFENDRVAGLIQMKNNSDKPIILVNKNTGPERRRFTIAHELGHFFLHANQLVHIDDLDTAEMVFYRDEKSSQATHLNEIQANQFAAELLMPREPLVKNIKKLREKNLGLTEIINELAEVYEVSVAAMTIRVNGLYVDLK